MATGSAGPPSTTPTVTLVTQTRVSAGHDAEFGRWQEQVNAAISQFPGYLEQTVMPPDPPAQVDWVVVQRFTSAEAARAWLQSDERLRLLDLIQPVLVGPDDVHLFTEATETRPVAPVTAVISMRVRPEQEADFLHWQRKIAAVEAEFEGFSGYKLEPPIPGVQDDWVTVLRFDSDRQLDAWLTSERRQELLKEAEPFSEAMHTRKVRWGFDPWFASTAQPGAAPPPAWKYNMILLLMLYPTVFLFGYWVQTPLLVARGMPFALSLFVSNTVSTILLGYLFVPPVARLFNWWLSPAATAPRWVDWAGVGIIVLLYALCMLVFVNLP
jgi:uncharacterized protein